MTTMYRAPRGSDRLFFHFFMIFCEFCPLLHGPGIAYQPRYRASQGKPLKPFSKEKSKVLARKNGWSLAHAEGFVDGESFRRRGKRPPNYVIIGIDEYCQGFRAGYFERKSGSSTGNPPASAEM